MSGSVVVLSRSAWFNSTPLICSSSLQETKRRGVQGGADGPASKPGEAARPDSRAGGAAAGAAAGRAMPPPQNLSIEEVVRRLRALKEPAILFGESDEQRFERMLLAEQNVQVGGGESAGG
jgi:hypothetical protein